jgi:hypothetical protein
VPFLCLVCATFVLTLFRHKDLCRFCASSVQGTKKAQNEFCGHLTALCLFCASFVQPLCSLFSDIKTCAGFVPVLCQAQKRHKMSCASFVLVLCQSVLILCFFCAWHRIGTNRNDQILCLVCAYFVRSLCVVCASLCHLFFTSVM